MKSNQDEGKGGMKSIDPNPMQEVNRNELNRNDSLEPYTDHVRKKKTTKHLNKGLHDVHIRPPFKQDS